MPASLRSMKTIVLSLALACAGAHAWNWVPSDKEGAQIANVFIGATADPDVYGDPLLSLKVTLQGVGEFTYYSHNNSLPIATLYQSLVQAKADSLPVILMADTATRLFDAVLIGNVDPQFPLALRDTNARPGTQAKIGMGYDLLGRSRSLAEVARAPLFFRPATHAP